MKTIASRDNPHFKALKKLVDSTRERRRTGLTVLDGVHLAQAWEDARGELRELLVSNSGSRRDEIAGFLAAHPATRTTILGDALFAELSALETPAGLLALIDVPAPAGGPRRDCDSVVLDGIQDPGNLGSILRTAAAAGFGQIVLAADCTQAWSPKALRAGMGAHFSLRIFEAVDLAGFLDRFEGLSVVTHLHAELDLFAAPLAAPLAWVFGHEGGGVRPEVDAAAKLRVRIPMPGTAESLNVAAAAAVCLFETVRRRRPNA